MSGPGLRVAAIPRDTNPYQGLLYDAMSEHGVTTTYLGELTPSHTLNVLLLPWQVLARRRDIDVVHLHWVWAFALPGRRRSRAVGAVSELWFHVFLRAVRASRAQLVWTAHNVLPHEPVFADDVRARRALASAADLVVVHHVATLDGLSNIGVWPRAAAVVPHGPFARPGALSGVARHESDGPIRFGFLGAVAEYKGIEDLLDAFGRLSPGTASLLVAGACADSSLESRVRAHASSLGDAVELRLRRLSDDELLDALSVIDVLVLPYREVTTSGSAVLGLGAGVPLVVPALPGLADLPDAAVFRYPRAAALVDALATAAATPRDRLRGMGESGRLAIADVSWEEIGAITASLLRGTAAGSTAVLT